MVAHLLSVLALGFLIALPQGRADDKAKKELAQLDGDWTLTKAEINGKSLLKKGDNPKLIIRNGRWIKGPKDAVELSGILDPSKKPSTITCPYEEAVFYGIYEVNGDDLRIC